MITIKKINYDNNYPYRLENSWGQVMCATEDELKRLMKDIKTILNKKEG